MMGPDGQLTLITFQDDARVIWKTPGADLQFTGAVSEEDMKHQILALTNQGTDVPADTDTMTILLVDGRDESPVLAGCVEQSGYDERAVFDSSGSDPVEEALDRLRLAATNEWAQCAREHGYPLVKDAQMPADVVNADPIALLPTTISEPELRNLLGSCPNFFPAVEHNNDEVWQRAADEGREMNGLLPAGLEGQPNVGFDYPGFRGNPEDEWPEGADADAMVDRLTTLVAVVDEPVNAYIQQEGG
jgi:hypothetical protein